MKESESHVLTHAEMAKVFRDIARQMDMPSSCLLLLYTLRVFQNRMALKDLVICSGLSKQTVHSSLAKLEKGGIVRLEKTDRKQKVVMLTEEGIDWSRETADQLIEFENSFLSACDPEENRVCLRFLRAYLAALRNQFGLSSS